LGSFNPSVTFGQKVAQGVETLQSIICLAFWKGMVPMVLKEGERGPEGTFPETEVRGKDRTLDPEG
jgi:hypothetical protein